LPNIPKPSVGISAVAFCEFAVEARVVAVTITESSTNEETAATLVRCPATISFVMPVSAVTSGGIGSDGSLNELEDILYVRDTTVRQGIERDHAKFD